MNNTLFNSVIIGNIFDNIILKKITLKDAYKLSLVNLALYKRMNEEYFIRIMKNRIETRLREILGVNFRPFIIKMNKVRAVLSGSFLHQCILEESYENTDIDIYTENLKKDEELNNFIKTFSAYSDSDDYGMYDKAFSCLRNITDHNIDNNNVLSEIEMNFIQDIDETKYDYVKPKEIRDLKQKIKKECTKIQVVSIKTSKEYNLWNHVKNTGFDVCRNMAYYDNDLNLQLRLFNIREIMFKRSTFMIQNITDFYYRIEKYSKRGFTFKPKYNKLLYLEYIYFKFAHIHILKTNFDEKIFNKLNGKGCGINCPIKLLFNDTRHYHTVSDKDPYDYGSGEKITTVENDGTFNRILPQLMHGFKMYYDKDKDRIKFSDFEKDDPMSRRNLREAVAHCNDLDEYAKIRNNFAKYPINVYSRTKEYKYDISFGKPCEFIKKEAVKKYHKNHHKDQHKSSNNNQDHKKNKGRNIK